jgi:hypothetical protein
MQVQGLELRELLRMLKEDQPGVYARFFQRIYNEDDRFHDWRLPLWDMAHSMNRFRSFYQSGRKDLPHDIGFLSVYIGASLEHNNPLFFVDRPLFDACAATGLPKGIRIADLHFPYDGLTFILPKGAFPTSEGEVAFITIARDAPGEKHYLLPDSGGGKPKRLTVETTDDAILIHTFFAKRAHDFTIRTTDTLYNDKEIPAFHEHLINESDDPLPLNMKLFGGNDKELDRVTLKLCSIVPMLLMAMECRPEIVERERRVKSLRRDRCTEVWTPNHIGRAYRVKLSGPDNGRGEHASPRQHWRRGHIRLMPIEHGHRCFCGHTRKLHDGFCMEANCPCKQYRLKYTNTRKHWIEPVLVN